MSATPDDSSLTQWVSKALSSYIDEYTGQPLAYTDSVVAVACAGTEIKAQIQLGYPAAGAINAMVENLQAHIRSGLAQQLTELNPHIDVNADVINSYNINIAVSQKIISHTRAGGVAGLDQVKNIIAIASGKGGVGKSATALNVALALQQEGATVGLLDADIYGPSQPLMLGVPVEQRPEVREQKYFLPIEVHGLQTMSMGYLVTEKTPMVWRGPMVSGALTQMVNQTQWHDVDYLIVDMPPGTGDIQLTLSQQVPVTGSAVVTTPQDIALLDAKKGIEMFHKVNIPCLGIIENMATHICSQCGHNEAIFGDGGGARIAAEYAVPLLGSLPLAMAIRQGLDDGKPIVATQPQSDIAQQYRIVARKLAAQLCLPERNASRAGPKITVSND